MQHSKLDISFTQTDNKTALQYWQDELCNKSNGTRNTYLNYFNKYLEYINMTADKLLKQRIEDSNNPDKKIQKRHESIFRKFLSSVKENYAPLTLQTIFASIRSFYEIHEYPLQMRKNDYPTGDSNGAKRATKEQIFQALNITGKDKTTTTAIIMTLKDTGLRISDLIQLKCDIIIDNPNKDFIPIERITQKTKLLAKTFIGEEAITALKAYLEKRKIGSRIIAPETITRNSPLFRTWTKGEVKQPSRTGISTLVKQAFISAKINKVSAHSLRRYFQTQMEEANINVNWIDQMIGHELVNCRGSYSKPSDEQLLTAYKKAYNHLRIYPTTTQQPTDFSQPQNTIEASTIEQIVKLLSKGYKIKLYKT